MKKIVVFLVCLLSLGLFIKPLAKAEEIGENEPEIIEEKELTQDEFIEIIKNKLGDLKENELILEIIGWLRDAGVITALLGVVIKYNKYKNKTLGELTSEVSDKAKELVNNKLNEYEKEIVELKATLSKVAEANETMMKVLVLMQDNSAKGKLAVLDYLSGKEKTCEEVIEEVKPQVEEVAEKTETLNEKIESIF